MRVAVVLVLADDMIRHAADVSCQTSSPSPSLDAAQKFLAEVPRRGGCHRCQWTGTEALQSKTKAVVHHKAPVLGLYVRGQVVRTWLISPETLVGHLHAQPTGTGDPCAQPSPSHGRTQLHGASPSTLASAWSGRMCSQPIQASPKHTSWVEMAPSHTFENGGSPLPCPFDPVTRDRILYEKSFIFCMKNQRSHNQVTTTCHHPVSNIPIA
jgi:hypothetical protein